MLEPDCFVTVGGRDPFGQQASWLVRSIRRIYTDEPTYVGIPETEEQSTPLPDDVTLVSVEAPLPEYMVSVQAATLQWVEQHTSHETIITLDPDMLLTNKLTISDQGADLYLKPTDLYVHHRLGDGEYWNDIYEAVGIERPEWKLRATISGRKSWPFYQAGIIATDGVQIARELLNYMGIVFEATNGDYWSEQIALTLLAIELETAQLTERQNFPLNLRVFAPPGIQLIHYKKNHHLPRAIFHRNLLRGLGIPSTIREEYPGWLYYTEQARQLRNNIFHRLRWRFLRDYGWERFQGAENE